MFDDEFAAIAFLRQHFPHFDDYEFQELVSLLIQDYAEETDDTEDWWEVNEDYMREWAENIVATCSF